MIYDIYIKQDEKIKPLTEILEKNNYEFSGNLIYKGEDYGFVENFFDIKTKLDKFLFNDTILVVSNNTYTQIKGLKKYGYKVKQGIVKRHHLNLWKSLLLYNNFSFQSKENNYIFFMSLGKIINVLQDAIIGASLYKFTLGDLLTMFYILLDENPNLHAAINSTTIQEIYLLRNHKTKYINKLCNRILESMEKELLESIMTKKYQQKIVDDFSYTPEGIYDFAVVSDEFSL
jgi:hypothetical protein